VGERSASVQGDLRNICTWAPAISSTRFNKLSLRSFFSRWQ
jgi:hypothetical protein